jgi:hypothetical protein
LKPRPSLCLALGLSNDASNLSDYSVSNNKNNKTERMWKEPRKPSVRTDSLRTEVPTTLETSCTKQDCLPWCSDRVLLGKLTAA